MLLLLLFACTPKQGDVIDPDATSDDSDGGDSVGGDGGDSVGDSVGDTGGDGGDGGETGLDPSPYEYEEDPPAPLLTAAAVEASLAASLPRVASLDPTLAWDIYDEAISHRDGPCPAVYDVAGVEAWAADCVSSSGWGYQGRYQGLHLWGEEVDGERFDEWGSMIAAAVITSPEGEVMDYSGDGELRVTTAADGSRAGSAWLQGIFRWSGSGGEGTWMDEGLSLSLLLEPAVDAAGGRTLAVDGGFSGDAVTDTLVFRDVVFSGAETGACASEPAGTLVVKDSAAESYEVSFGDDCDGCGEVTFRGASLGDACADFSGFMSWSGWPW